MAKTNTDTWKKHVPYEIESRFIEVGNENFTLSEAIEEAKYIIDMIQSGGSSYNDDEDEGKATLKKCKTFLKKYKA
ncbi:hypothetical protein EDM57_05050 [Brevibacillus gelatini]|uniref:Uncharacterized protein n=1 Tax=Brevibacillus gelatini TaxID=1655277 RepID=A0A3M8B823_9BACL|nr:hypothetical protein [Brevibacillus gelatini]RNB59510.1 hypothetical protein EDM57_05050 [Brevibacillus gelatini]